MCWRLAKMINKSVAILLTLIFFLFSLSTIQATNLNDLINSYSFDHNIGVVKVGDVSDSMDAGVLSFCFDASSKYGGNYSFYIDLEDEGGIVSGENHTDLNSSFEQVCVGVDSYFLSGREQFSYRLRVYDSDGALVLFRENLSTNVYYYNPSLEVLGVLDYIADDYVALNILFNSSVVGEREVSGYLDFGGRKVFVSNNFSFGLGANEVILKIGEAVFRKSHFVGSFNVDKIFAGRKFLVVNYSSSAYNFRDFVDGGYLDNYSSDFVDEEDDGVVDYLELGFFIDAYGAGNYEVLANVYDLDGNFLFAVNETKVLGDSEKGKIDSRVDSGLIYSLGYNGPYFVRDVSLSFDEKVIDFDSEGFSTGEFSDLDFKRAALPDLVVLLSGDDENINVSIENIGKAGAFGFGFEVFDEFNYSHDWFVDSLGAGESVGFGINVSGAGEFFVGVVDFDGAVEEENESNNFGSINLSECVSLLINSSWGKWENVSECLRSGTVLQNRSRVLYDSNVCGNWSNVSFWESREVFCEYDAGLFRDCLKDCQGNFVDGLGFCGRERVAELKSCWADAKTCLSECRNGGWFRRFKCGRSCIFEEIGCYRGALGDWKGCISGVRGEKVGCRAECRNKFGI